MQVFKTSISNIEDLHTILDECKDKKNFFASDLSKCYKIVENFIKRNKRILVGGMAIDFALKLHDSLLYKTDKIDYDFISPEYHRDAYNLGNELALQFEGISVICALHASTMKVRYKFMPVADITFVGQPLYDKMLYKNFNGFRIIHPNVQMIDQLRAMTFIAENPPRETYIGSRLSKDIKRFCMLSEFYPMSDVITAKTIGDIKYINRAIPLKLLKNRCLGGIPAAAYWSKKLNLGLNLDINIDSTMINITMPEAALISIYSDEPSDLLISNESTAISGESTAISGESTAISNESKQTNLHTYRPLLDKFPKRTIFAADFGSVELFHSKGLLIASDKLQDFHVISLYGTMLYLLTRYFLVARDSWLIPIIHKFYQTILDDFDNNLTYWYDEVEFFGEYNWTESYLLSIKKQTLQLQGKRLEGILPKNFYPSKNKLVPDELFQFDPTKSEVLNNNGELDL